MIIILFFKMETSEHIFIWGDPISTVDCIYVSAHGKWTTSMTHDSSICHLWSQQVSLLGFLHGVKSTESVIMLLRSCHLKSVCNQKLYCLNCPQKTSLPFCSAVVPKCRQCVLLFGS